MARTMFSGLTPEEEFAWLWTSVCRLVVQEFAWLWASVCRLVVYEFAWLWCVCRLVV
jgi:hypothetical protein